MLVADNRRRSNPRVLYGILAESALEQLKSESPEEDQLRAYFKNLIRLLEMYRYGSLRRPSPRAILDRRQSDLKSREREQLANADVEQALDAARQTVYGDLDKAQTVDLLKSVFEHLIRDELAAVEADALSRATQFLEAFAAALRA